MIEQVFREHWGRVLASLVGVLGDFELAEDACQDAFVIAAERWPQNGEPSNPVSWLVTTGRNRAIDRLRRERRLAEKTRLLEVPPTVGEVERIEEPVVCDERLELIFCCCHPALATEAQVALTLRSLAGLSTEQIADAFLVTAEAMKRRLTRARAKITAAGIPFAIPDPSVLSERVDAVLAVVYLIFNQGYTDGGDLTGEAIELGRALVGLMPEETEVLGLLALMLLVDARTPARSGDEQLVLLADQDRSLWNLTQIAEGHTILKTAVRLKGRGVYVLQAAIASLHCSEPVDWRQITTIYDKLTAITGSPVIELNRAIAIAEAGSPATALAIVDGLELNTYRYLHTTRGELLARLGRAKEAHVAYQRALKLTTSRQEQRFINRRLDELQIS